MTPPLTHEQVPAFWEERHRTLGHLSSGGDRGLSETDNQIFYYSRLGQLMDLIGHFSDSSLPLTLLDAGCGKGFFAEHLARCGHSVVAFDPSRSALASVREPHAIYHRSTIESFQSEDLFDVVYSIDVLFHILEDDVWATAVRKLASFVRYPGQLIITDYNSPSPIQLGDYIVHRPPSAYAEILGPLGFSLRRQLSYGMPANPNHFHEYAPAG